MLKKLVDANGEFRFDRNDHRYDSIPGAWIRVISRGNTAYRAIYLRKGSDIYLYRAGEHFIEDNLQPPADSATATILQPAGLTATAASFKIDMDRTVDSGKILYSNQQTCLKHIVLGRRLIPHKEVFLVSPYLSISMFEPFNAFGKMLFDFIEDGTTINLITQFPSTSAFRDYSLLESRGIRVFFHTSLHAKLYTFELDSERLDQYQTHHNNLAILGSANLTEPGFALSGKNYNEELCYALPLQSFQEALDFVYFLSLTSTDLETCINRYGRKKDKGEHRVA